jgi:hypothetical protein
VSPDADAEADLLHVSDKDEGADQSQHDEEAIQRATYGTGHENTSVATYHVAHSNTTPHCYAYVLSLHPETNQNANHEAHHEAHTATDADAVKLHLILSSQTEAESQSCGWLAWRRTRLSLTVGFAASKKVKTLRYCI